jgi:inhibitor of cysteine peptidase
MHKRNVTIFFLILLASFSVYADPEPETLPTYTDSKPAVVVTAQQPVFVIKLKSNPTTGYSWFLREYNDSGIQAVKHVFVAPTDKKLVGEPGYELWTFRVKPAGFVVPQQMMVRFTYTRPWESNDNSTQIVFSVTTSGK